MNSKKTNDTVIELIKKLNISKSKYCIARNYDYYPVIDNDLDLFFNDDIRVFRKIARDCAGNNEWDYLVESKRWHSLTKESCVYVFIFLTKDGSRRLQVDLFQGFSLLGAALIDAEKIIENSIYNKKTKSNVAGVITEGLLHVFQISSLINDASDRAEKKIDMYKRKIFNSNEIDSVVKIDKMASSYGLTGIRNALSALENENYRNFKYNIFYIKIKFFIRSLMQRPKKTILGVAGRIKYYLKCIYDPYFMVIEVPALNKDGDNFLRELKSNKIVQLVVVINNLSDWVIKLKEILQVIERGGLIVWVNNEKKNLEINLSRDIILRQLIKKIICRDEIIWHSPVTESLG
jgi:hypothetical protein